MRTKPKSPWRRCWPATSKGPTCYWGTSASAGGSSPISTKRLGEGSSPRSNCLKNDGRGRTTCTAIAKRPSNCSFNGSFGALGLKECQVKGEGRNGAFVLASVWLSQICDLTNYREGKPLAWIKEHLDCAR